MTDDRAPLVNTGDIEAAEFDVRRIVVEDGEVVEENVDARMDDREVAELREEIRSKAGSAMDALDQGEAEDVNEAVQSASDQDVSDAIQGAGSGDTMPDSEAAESAVEPVGPQQDESPTDDQATGEAAEQPSDGPSQRTTTEEVGTPASDHSIARNVVTEENITTTDFVTFQAEIDNRGLDRDRASELWDQLREEDEIPKGTVGGGDDDADLPEDPPDSPPDTVSGDDGNGNGGGDDDGVEVDLPADAAAELEAGELLLVADQDEEASNAAITAVAGAIENEELKTLMANEGFGQGDLLDAVLAPLPSPVELPAAVRWTGTTFEEADLQALFEEYA